MPDKNNLWKVNTNKFDNEKESIMRNGNLYQISNGYMGYRGTLDEFGRDELVGITVAGIFDKVGDEWREPVNAPNGGYTIIKVDGKKISALETDIVKHEQTLDITNATFERKTVFKEGSKKINISSKRFLSIDKPNLGAIEYSFSTDKDAKIVVETGIDYNIWDLSGKHLVNEKASKKGNVLLYDSVTNELKKQVCVAELTDFKGLKEEHVIKSNYNLRKFSINAEAGKTYKLTKNFAVFKDGDTPGNLIDAAVKTVEEAKSAGFSGCLKVHDELWKKRWEQCDVIIEGDDEAQLALRYSIFQLLIVAPVKGSANSIPARALSGQVYKGAIFWDTEMFMFPFFVYTYPEVAVELLRYRIQTLDGARRKAKTEGPGFRGAYYAWESQESGDDACTYFNIGDPHTGRLLRTHFRDKQVHISGDIAIAMWEYFKLTGDDSLLLEGGAEVILECARFYYSYAYFKKDKNRYEILDVIGPDEYHERVNNNAFTNKVAKVTFEIALEVVNYFKEKHPDALKKLLEKIDIAHEIPQFEEAYKLLYVPQPDPETKVIEQFDTYYKLEEVSVEEVKKRTVHPNEYLGAGQGVAVPTKVIKQADVIMMLNLFKDRFPVDIKKANWEYYEPRTEHGSSLSACAYALVAADVGKIDWAYKYFLKTARLDIEAKYKVYVGTIFMGGSHPAANGGAWMAAIFGFGGVKANKEKVTINPRLYSKWKKLSFNLSFKQDSFAVNIDKKKVVVVANKNNADSRAFSVANKELSCKPGETIEIKY
ncbi:MAG: glycoside hydrolase family 65 protein [Bacteroidales bacterium]|nr:glycoside hydrolase family 65 protein [Bacteroidales bacterium]